MDNSLKIEYIPIEDIKPYKNNAKLHPKEQIQQIKNSILEFGFKDPIAIWNDTIVEGHGRLLAAQELGYKELPVIRLDDLTDEQRKAYTLAHNKLTMNSDFDLDILTAELDDITDIDMSDFGFDLDFDNDEPAEVVEDDYDEEPPEEPKAKLGDIYQLGRHRLMCGDSTKAEDIETLIADNKIQLALTDPPYGISVVQGNQIDGGGATHFGKVGGKNIVKSSTYMAIKGDETTDTAKENYQILKEISDNQIIFGGNYFTDFLPPKACWCIWDKQNTGNFADCEMAWTSFDKGAKLYHWLWNGLCRKGERAVEGVSRVHPTQKPVGMLGDIIKDFSEKNDNIIDCFGGSGSTLMACEQTERNCYMMEYEPHYIDVIIDRWEKFTGQKAVKLN
jgi:site-specific DNA-methyltransferase (adenine-specific)